MPARPISAGKTADSQAGFTLLEVLVALIIFGIGFGALAGIFQTSLRQSTTADGLMDATMLAETQLARFGRDWPLQAGTTEGVVDDGLSWRAEVTVARLSEGDGTLALYRIRVEVEPSDGVSGPVALSTLRIGTRP